MKCPQCKGVIERDTALCPHCGAPRSGKIPVMRPVNRPTGKPDPIGRSHSDSDDSLALSLRNLWAFITRDTQTKIASSVVAGAIIGAVLPGVSWVIGGLVGGFIAYRITERKT